MIEFDAGWGQRLEGLNEMIDGLEHKPAEIPRAPMVNSADSRDLAALVSMDLVKELESLLPRPKAIQAKIKASVRGFLPRAKLLTGFASWLRKRINT